MAKNTLQEQMSELKEQLQYLYSEEYADRLQDRMSLVSRGDFEDVENNLYETRNELARTQRELSQLLKIVAAMIEQKQVTVIRHAGGTTINVTDHRSDEPAPVWEKPQLKVVK
jgi:hypothetical protein